MTHDNSIELFAEEPMNEEHEELLALARGLGNAQVARLDPDRIAKQVVARATAARRADRRRTAGVWVSTGIAAAALLLVVGPRIGRDALAPQPAVIVAPAVASNGIHVDELDGLGKDELQSLLESLDARGLESAPVHGVHGLQDMNAHELQAVLDGLDG